MNPVFARGHIDFFMAAKTQQKNKRWAKRGETAPPAAIAALRRIAPAHVPDAALAALAAHVQPERVVSLPPDVNEPAEQVLQESRAGRVHGARLMRPPCHGGGRYGRACAYEGGGGYVGEIGKVDEHWREAKSE